jgi:hypothetical protein
VSGSVEGGAAADAPARFGRAGAFGWGAFRRGPGFRPPRAAAFFAWVRLAFAAFTFVFAIKVS